MLDTETTGFVPRVHRVIEFASVEVRDGKVTQEYEQLFFHKEVPPHVEVLTRIKTPSLVGKPSFEEKREEILKHIPEDAVIVGQNVMFDIGMLKGEGIDLTDRPWIDTSMLASLVFPELRSYSLGYLSAVLGLNHNPPHRALGDVRATLSLLEKCWDRFGELPESLLEPARSVMSKSAPGYRSLFAALPASAATKAPAWLGKRPQDAVPSSVASLRIDPPMPGQVELREEPIDPAHLQAILRGSVGDKDVRQWIAVKNLRASVRKLPPDIRKKIADDEIRVLRAAPVIADTAAVMRFLKQDQFTADEATIAVKLHWYLPADAGAKEGPSRLREDLPLHGGEEAVWNGKLRATETSPDYTKQFKDAPGVVVLDHRELLSIVDAAEHPAHQLLDSNKASERAGLVGPASEDTMEGKGEPVRGKPLGFPFTNHIVIDDASMLEDTATKAYGWQCSMDDLRAASAGDELLTRFTDVLQLWIEKTRQGQDLRYLAVSDVKTPEARGLREQLQTVIDSKPWPERMEQQLRCVQKVLDPENLGGRITWIELRYNGTQMLESVPERIGEHLLQTLFSKHAVSLLIPSYCAKILPEILPQSIKQRTAGQEDLKTFVNTMPISLDPQPTLDDVFQSPPPGKTVLLLPGKSTIEDLYVKHTERLEQAGVTMICQGMSGGQGRMQAEFLAAEAPALWLLTPWMFEGLELPPGSVDQLILKTLPFDHPNHAVISRRSQHYGDPFNAYSLPRLIHRVFRLFRTYARFRTENGSVRILDERLTTKSYGKTVREFLGHFAAAELPAPAAKPTAPKKKPAPKKEDKPGQMAMF